MLTRLGQLGARRCVVTPQITSVVWHTWQGRRNTFRAKMRAEAAPDVYHMGLDTLRISRKELHGTIRTRFLHMFRDHLKSHGLDTTPGVVLLQGGSPFHVYSTDGELVFRQESYMHYLFGVVEEDWYGALDVATGKAHLFMPRLPESYAVWMGHITGPEEYRTRYAVDEVHYTEDLAAVLRRLLRAQQGTAGEAVTGEKGAGVGAGAARLGPVHVLQGTNSDSGREVLRAQFEGCAGFELEGGHAWAVLTEARVAMAAAAASTAGCMAHVLCMQRKMPGEIEIMRYANQVGSAGHVAMMQAARPGMMEYQLEATYLHKVYASGGCRLPNYTPIAASGPNGAVLHYGHAGAPNDRQLSEGDMVLVDMGCEYYRYGSDITCTWPASGKFSPQQRVVYCAVLAAHTAVIAAMRPGVAWPDMHTLANRVLLSELKAGGLVQGDVEEALAADMGALFMPHGLGHFLGIDTHDVGGYGLPSCPPRLTRPGYKSLRTARTLEAGMVITVEPGCYFPPALFEPALKDPTKLKFLVPDVVRQYVGFGGVRIEDNVVVTETGAESLTHVPRTPEEIEAVMGGAAWPLKKQDTRGQLK